MTPIEDPLACRAFFVAYEGMGLPSPRQAEATFVSGPVTVTMAGRVRSSSTGRLWRMKHLAPKLRVFVDFLAANLVPAVEGEADRALHPPTASGPSVRHASPSSATRHKAL